MLDEPSPQPAAPVPAGSRLLRNVGLLSGSLLVTSTLTAVWTLFVPRLLGPAGMGLIVMAWSASGIFVALGGLGMRTLLVRSISAHPQDAPRLLGTAMLVRAGSILPCLAITTAYVVLGHFGREQALVLYLATALAVCTLFLEPLLAAFQAIERMEYLAYADVLNKALLAIGGITLVLLGFRAPMLVAWLLAAAALVLSLNLLWIHRYFRIDWRIEPSAVAPLIRASLPYWTYGLFFNIYLWIDSAMLAVISPPRVVGWYGVATKLFGTLMFIPAILNTAWLPRLVSAFTQNPSHLRLVVRAPTEQIMILSLPVSIGAALVAQPLIGLLYGRAYAPAVPVLIILALTVIPTYFNIVTNQILVTINRQMVWTKALAFASVVNPCFNLVLIRIFQDRSGNGAIGAAWSFLLTELLLVGIGVVVIRRYLHWGSLRRVARSALATAGMAGVVLTVARFGIVPQVVAGGLSFGALALLLRLPTPDELSTLDRLRGRAAIGARVRRLWAW
jgi:O-antigen/teichoic acid export membrane protein